MKTEEPVVGGTDSGQSHGVTMVLTLPPLCLSQETRSNEGDLLYLEVVSFTLSLSVREQLTNYLCSHISYMRSDMALIINSYHPLTVSITLLANIAL